MGEIDQLRLQLQELSAEFVAAVKNLTDSYPYAATYGDVPNERNALEKAEYMFRTVARKLKEADAALGRIRRSQITELKKLGESTEKLTAANAKHMIRLQGYENAAAGALGMYGDTRYLYNSALIQTIGLGLASGALVYSAVTYRIT